MGEDTGLQDKNGQEIYEGDIVVAHIADSGYAHDHFVVKLEDGQFRLLNNGNEDHWVAMWPTGEDYEVIGNVQDNPELLV